MGNDTTLPPRGLRPRTIGKSIESLRTTALVLKSGKAQNEHMFSGLRSKAVLPILNYSRRQPFANAAIAASRVVRIRHRRWSLRNLPCRQHKRFAGDTAPRFTPSSHEREPNCRDRRWQNALYTGSDHPLAPTPGGGGTAPNPRARARSTTRSARV